MKNACNVSDFLKYAEIHKKCEAAAKRVFDLTVGDYFRTREIPDEVEYKGFGVVNDGKDIALEYDEGYDDDLIHREFTFPIEWVSYTDELVKSEFEVLRKTDDYEWLFPDDE